MNPRRIFATAGRVLRQLRHDPRTIALLLVVPILLMVLLRYMFDGSLMVFNHIGAPLLALFPLLMMFLITSIGTLRERRSGTLERLMTMPLGKLDFLLGYGLAFGLVAVVQAVLVSVVTVEWLGLSIAGSLWMLVLVAVVDGLLGTALGLFVSAFAETEFQAVQFMPAVILPQALLCGLLIDRSQMAELLRWVSDVMPLTYAVDAMQQVTNHSSATSNYVWDVVIVAGCVLAALVLGAMTLKRRTG